MESSPSPALISPLSDHKLAMEKLIKGRDLARELQHILNYPRGSHGLDSPGILVERVIGSFVDAISALNDSAESPETTSGSKPASTLVHSSCSDGQVVEHSSECRTIPASKKGRRAFKRRKTSEAWSRVTATPLDDGHGWRKYGQKYIQGAQHPRSYFRCTHSHDQNCEASKQVQQMEDDSSMYLIKYIGKHTCRDPHLQPLQPLHPIILDYSTPKEKCFLNFQSTDHLIMRKEEEHYYSNQPSFFSSLTSMKQDEYNNPFLGHPLHDHKGNSVSSNSALPAFEEKSFASSVSSIGFPAMENSDVNEILSISVCSVTSSPILETDTMVDSIRFEDMFDQLF